MRTALNKSARRPTVGVLDKRDSATSQIGGSALARPRCPSASAANEPQTAPAREPQLLPPWT